MRAPVVEGAEAAGAFESARTARLGVSRRLAQNVGELAEGAGGQVAQAALWLNSSKRGARGVHSLRGPFAALVWDKRTDTLLVARDHVGLQPLYVAPAAACG